MCDDEPYEPELETDEEAVETYEDRVEAYEETVETDEEAVVTCEEPVEARDVEVEADDVEVQSHHVDELIELGLALLQREREDEAYAAFKKATSRNGEWVAAWFWRAKTARTLDEVVRCLERASRIEPENAQVAANLESARRRVAANQAAANQAAAKASKARTTDTPAVVSFGRKPIGWRAVGWAREICRAAAAMAAFVIGAVCLLAALPDQIAHGVVGDIVLPSASGLTSIFHLSLAGGYDAGSAAPLALGFLGLFVGTGLLSGDGWTRFWGPAIGVAIAWAWSLAPGASMGPYLLPARGAVVLGGALAGKWSFVRLD